MAESLIDCVVEAIRPLLSDISLPYDMVAKMHVKDGLLIEIAQAAITAMGDASCEVKESKEPCPSLTNQTLIGKLNAIRLDWQTDAQQDKVYAMDYIIPIVASHLEREYGDVNDAAFQCAKKAFITSPYDWANQLHSAIFAYLAYMDARK